MIEYWPQLPQPTPSALRVHRVAPWRPWTLADGVETYTHVLVTDDDERRYVVEVGKLMAGGDGTYALRGALRPVDGGEW